MESLYSIHVQTEPQSTRIPRSMRTAIVGSILAHILVGLMLFVGQKWFPAPKSSEPLIVELAPSKEKQIVQTEKGRKVDVAPEDAFLGKENRVAQKQMTAKPQESTPPAHDARTGARSGPLSKFGLNLLKPTEGIGLKEDSPDFAKFSDSFGAVAPQEFVKGLEKGQETALNTREFVFFSYFQRIREQLDRAWRPVLKDQLVKMYNRGRMLASDKEHTTKTVVTLNSTGEIVRIQVLEESGTKDLDEAAIRAFNKAGPFPNPPRQLIDAAGKIEIRWDFVLRT